MRSYVRTVVLSALFVMSAQTLVHAIDVEWSQRAWTYSGYSNFVIADLTDGTNFNYNDGDFFFPGMDYRGIAPIFLAPYTSARLLPYINEYVDFLYSYMSPPYTASGVQVHYIDSTTWVPGKAPENPLVVFGIYPVQSYPVMRFGSYKVGFTANNGGVLASNFSYMRYLSNTYHPRVTSITNMFLFFYSKNDSPSASDGKRFRFSIMLKQASGGAWEKRWDVSNFSFPTRNWTFNSTVVNIPDGVLGTQLVHATYNPTGIIETNTVMIPHFNVTDYLEHSTASAFNLVSNSIWLDSVVFANEFIPWADLVSSPIAIPQYTLNAGTMYKCTNLKSIYIGGINSYTNHDYGVSNALMQSTGDLNHYRGSGVRVDIYLRSADSVDALKTARWTGIDTWQDIGGIP
ncbi:MAG: hypothetical protein AABZ39_09760, partial [Spirochaetota bacterium]